MTEDFDQQNQQETEQKITEKKQLLLVKLVAVLAIIFFGYFAFKYWQISQIKKIHAKAEVEKFDNIDSEIFDLSAELKDNSEGNGISELTINEMKEGGAEFIYKMLLKNQVQINYLKEQLSDLKSEVLKYKNHEKIAKMILLYVDLREKFLSGHPYDENLRSLETLSSSDEKLQTKLLKLKLLLKEFQPQEKLSKKFSDLIPDLIIAKNNNPNASVLARVQNNISKMVIIRKINDKNSQTVDAIIARTEEFLQEEKYQEAMNSLLSLDANYHTILQDFLNVLNVSIETQKTDQEILTYLKSLS